MHNFYGIRSKTDSFRKGYVLDTFDQPTYLTFALDFGFESGEEIGADLLWTSPLFKKGGPNISNSAQTYLGSIGHKDKEVNLAKFKSILEYLTFNAPWYFQQISGLEKLWTNATNMASGYKGNEAVLTIDTLEAIDLRVMEIANLYRSAIYDKQSMRERVPDNLRWFTMDIYIAEGRNIRYRPLGGSDGLTSALGINTGGLNRFATGVTSALGTLSGDLDLASTMKQFGFIKFRCRQCEFDFSSSFNSQNLSTSPGDRPTTGQFKIKVGYFEEVSEYQDGTKLDDNLLRASLRDPWSAKNKAAKTQNIAEGATFLPIIGDKVSDAMDSGKEKLKSVGGLINNALGAAISKTSYPYLGKIY
jgi:hypothetical protein